MSEKIRLYSIRARCFSINTNVEEKTRDRINKRSGNTLWQEMEERMGKKTISVSHEFNVPREEVFAIIADPYKLAEINSFSAERIKDSTSHDINGVGSVRRLTMGIFSSIDEAITVFDVPERIEYRVLSGVPIRNHVGRIKFVDLGNGRSRVEFSIEFDSVFPGLGSLLRMGLQRAVVASLRNIEARLQ